MVRPQPPMRSDSRKRRPSHLPLCDSMLRLSVGGNPLPAAALRCLRTHLGIPVNPKSVSARRTVAVGCCDLIAPRGGGLSRAIRLYRVGDEDAGTQQAQQGGCFKHGTYSLAQCAEVQAEMARGKGEGETNQAPRQDHIETRSADGDFAGWRFARVRSWSWLPTISGCDASLPNGPCNIRDRAGSGLLTWSASLIHWCR